MLLIEVLVVIILPPSDPKPTSADKKKIKNLKILFIKCQRVVLTSHEGKCNFQYNMNPS